MRKIHLNDNGIIKDFIPVRVEYKLHEQPGMPAPVFGPVATPLPDSTQYDALAQDYMRLDSAVTHITRKWLYEEMEPADIKGKKVLDVGLAYGRDALYCRTQGAKIYGVDESNKQVNLAKTLCKDGHFLRADPSKLPFFANLFDVVYSRYGLHHCSDMDPGFYEIARVLKPGGKFILIGTHPMRHYFEKPTRDYELQEEVTSKIFDGKLVVKEQSHTMMDYLSPLLLNNFTLEKVVEKVDVETERVANCGKYPGILMITCRRNDRSVLSRFDWSNEFILMGKEQKTKGG